MLEIVIDTKDFTTAGIHDMKMAIEPGERPSIAHLLRSECPDLDLTCEIAESEKSAVSIDDVGLSGVWIDDLIMWAT